MHPPRTAAAAAELWLVSCRCRIPFCVQYALIVLGPVDLTQAKQCVPEMSTELHERRYNVICPVQEVHTYCNIVVVK